MSEIIKGIKIPLDDEGYLRRECPFCMNEFKILPKEEDLDGSEPENLEQFMIEEDKKDGIDDESSENEVFCPYCGQQAEEDQWFTQEQADYINSITQNIVADLINDNLINPLKRNLGGSSRGMISVEFKGDAIEKENEWVSSDLNDMMIFELPCCQSSIKIEDDWKGTVYCFFCGFPYK